MTLAARVSWFFLLALGAVLLGFSISLYLLARSHLHAEVEDRLASALDTLAASVVSDPDGLEWEPDHHHLTLGRSEEITESRWEVRDGENRLIGRSNNLGTNDSWLPTADRIEGSSVDFHDGAGRVWRTAVRRLNAPAATIRPDHYATLVLTAGVCLEPLHATLRGLAFAVGGLSVMLWFAAALVGRRLCRRSLRPVERLAVAARSMGAADLSVRLPSPGTEDELD